MAGLPRRVVPGLLLSWTSQAATGLSALVVTPLLLHHLGRSAFGVWTLASGVVTYFELFELGFGNAGVKLVAEDASSRRARAVRTLNTVFATLVPLGVLALGVGLVVAFSAPSLFRIPTALHSQAVIVFALLSLGLAVSIPGDTFGGALQAFQRFDLLSAVNTMLVIVGAAVSVAVVLDHEGLVALAAATTAVSISFHGVRWKVLRRVFPEARLRLRYVDRTRIREAAALSGWFMVSDVASTMISTADLVVVGIIFGVRATAVYAVGFKLAQMAQNARGAFAWMLLPHASAISRREDKEGKEEALRSTVIDGTRVGLLVSMILTLVLIALAYPGIEAWVGPGYGRSAQVLTVLVAAFAVSSVVTPMSMVLSGAGHIRLTSVIAVANAACNLAFSVLLAHLLGPIGVALGTLCGAFLIQMPVLLVVGNRALGMAPGLLARRSILPHLVPATASAAVLFGLRGVLGQSVAGLVGTAVAGVAVYLAAYLLFGATRFERHRVHALVDNLIPGRR